MITISRISLDNRFTKSERNCLYVHLNWKKKIDTKIIGSEKKKMYILKL